MSARTASSSAQAAASKMGAQLALELVGYDAELKAAMAYVFGNAFICKVRLHDSGPHFRCKRPIDLLFIQNLAALRLQPLEIWDFPIKGQNCQTDHGSGLTRSALRYIVTTQILHVACFSQSVRAPQDPATAKRVAFDRAVQTRCITIEGDDFNPGGTLTGGSRTGGSSVLARLAQLTTAEEELGVHREALAAAQRALQAMAAAAKQYAKCVL